jgi:hypothetical protein
MLTHSICRPRARCFSYSSRYVNIRHCDLVAQGTKYSRSVRCLCLPCYRSSVSNRRERSTEGPPIPGPRLPAVSISASACAQQMRQDEGGQYAKEQREYMVV